MQNVLRTLAFLFFLTSFLFIEVAKAETPQEKGLAVATESDLRDIGFGDSRANLRMVLTNRHGETSERELRMRTLEIDVKDEGDKTLITFDKPKDVKGTSLLTFTHVLAADDQWLYLPALKRVKRISSNNKSGPFMGSEFSYEDFSSQEVNKYDYTWLRDEACGELECFVVERKPLYEHSGYQRQITWTDKAEYRIQRVDFYDRKNSLLKTLNMTDYRKYLDKYWRAHNLLMENHQTGKKTRLTWSGYQFRTGLTEDDFTTGTLKRMR